MLRAGCFRHGPGVVTSSGARRCTQRTSSSRAHSRPGGLVVLGIGVYRSVLQAWWNRDVFPTLYENWESTFQCTRCENRFIP